MSADVGGEELLDLFARGSVPVSRSFQYSNVGYILAAQAVEHRTGKPWQDLVREKVLAPLGLTHTSTVSPTGPDVAERYAALGKGVFRLLPAKTSRSYNAAGGMSSTLTDLVSWLQVNMNDGQLGARQVFPARVMQELHSVQIRTASVFGGFRRIGYGLGWYVVNYDGELMIQCFGSHAGTRVHISFLPRRGIGVVVIANEGRDGVYLPDVIAHGLYDVLLDRGARAERQRRRFDEQHEWIRRVQDDRKDVKVDHQLPIPLGPEVAGSRFVGAYRDSLWGDVVVSLDQGGLLAQMGELRSYLNPVNSLTFTADLTPGGLPSIQTLEFKVDPAGTIQGFGVQLGRKPSTFERVGGRQ
jgi:hypothetical protein